MNSSVTTMNISYGPVDFVKKFCAHCTIIVTPLSMVDSILSITLIRYSSMLVLMLLMKKNAYINFDSKEYDKKIG